MDLYVLKNSVLLCYCIIPCVTDSFYFDIYCSVRTLTALRGCLPTRAHLFLYRSPDILIKMHSSPELPWREYIKLYGIKMSWWIFMFLKTQFYYVTTLLAWQAILLINLKAFLKPIYSKNVQL